MRTIFALLAALLSTACTIKGEPASTEKVITCADTRDGERFSFKESSIQNARIGFLGADTCAEITTTEGEQRTVCKSQELYLKCAPARGSHETSNATD